MQAGKEIYRLMLSAFLDDIPKSSISIKSAGFINDIDVIRLHGSLSMPRFPIFGNPKSDVSGQNMSLPAQ